MTEPKAGTRLASNPGPGTRPANATLPLTARTATAARTNANRFMTATPRYFTGRVKREAAAADYELASMDDEAHFGGLFHQLTFGENRVGLRARYDVDVPPSDQGVPADPHLRAGMKRRDILVDAKLEASQVALDSDVLDRAGVEPSDAHFRALEEAVGGRHEHVQLVLAAG